eukprot:scaffold1138_cov128-Cylindrotheca_fusiformis.AAC.17
MKIFMPLLCLVCLFRSLSAFTTTSRSMVKSTSLSMAAENNEDLLRWARASRSAGSDDNVVELMRPLGLVLNQDDNGNVYVEAVAPKGNAARTGKVKEGDIVTMCSATFGDEMWSTRGVGLTRVLAAIRVRSGNTVKLVLESPDQYKKKASVTKKQRQAMEDARKAAQAKKDELLKELEKDEERLKTKKFFGLF